MRNTHLRLLTGLLLSSLLVACSPTSAHAPSQEPAQPAATAAQVTPLPTFTALPAAAPATAVQPTAAPQPTQPAATKVPGPAVELDQIHMLNNQAGWAWSAPQGQLGQLLRTSDGGATWTDVSPKLKDSSGQSYSYYGSFFLDEKNAWVDYFDTTANNGGLLQTSDGGQTWTALPPNQYLGNARAQFSSAANGLAETADMGAGQAHLTYYQTKDGGNTWTLIPLKAPSPEPNLPDGTLHLCNICGDQLYYDPARAVIAQGDMANDPVGVVRLSVSTDLGAHWTNLQLPFPAKYAGASVSPMQPVFFDKTGLLPVNLIKYDAKGALAFSALVIYTSQDGGQTWQAAPAALENQASLINNVQILSAKDAFAVCGKNLCATNDGAQTWKTLASSLNFDQSTGAADAVTQFGFIDPSNGWAVSGQSGATTLWHTTDGGATWAKLAPRLNQ